MLTFVVEYLRAERADCGLCLTGGCEQLAVVLVVDGTHHTSLIEIDGLEMERNGVDSRAQPVQIGLHERVAVVAAHTTVLCERVIVLGAVVALVAGDVLAAALAPAVYVALLVDGTLRMALAGRAAVRAEAVVVGRTLIALGAHNTRPTAAHARLLVACQVERAERVAAALLAAGARHQVPVGRSTPIALATHHIGSTRALATRQLALGVLAAVRRAVARVTLALAGRLAPVGAQAALALDARRVEHAAQTLARLAVAVADRVVVNVAVAGARRAFEHRVEGRGRARLVVAVVALVAQVAARALWTLETHELLLLIALVRCANERARAVVRTRTLLAVAGRAEQRVAVVARLALLALLASRVLRARARACLGVAAHRVVVARARHTAA